VSYTRARLVPGPLSASQIDDFVERGWTILEHAFPATVAQAVRRELGRRIGIDLERPEEWTESRVWLQEVMETPPFTDALTKRFEGGVDQLVGRGRWRLDRLMGWWPVTFPGFLEPPYGDDWHVEGGWSHRHIWSPEQAVLNLFCFSTVEPGGGGTKLVEGSHLDAARLFWAAEPEGLKVDPPINALLNERGWPGVVEVTAEEGDVVLAHPLVVHASNPNHGTRPRVMSQPGFSMTEPKRTEGEGIHPVEIPLARTKPPGQQWARLSPSRSG
jgi:hypothetical protein